MQRGTTRRQPTASPVSRGMAFIGTSLIDQCQNATSGRIIGASGQSWIDRAWFYSMGQFDYYNFWDSTVLVGWEPSGVGGTTRFHNGLNFGVSGQTTQQIEDRLPLIRQNWINQFGTIVVDAGTNDVNTATTKEDIQAGRERICQFFLSLGKRVILLPILHRGLTAWAAGTDARKKANWINNRTQMYVDKTPNVILFDWNEDWTDATTANSVPRTGASNDDTHFNTFGADYVGASFARFIAPLFPPAHPFVFSPDDDYDATINTAGILSALNDFSIGTGGAVGGTSVSGTVAAGMRAERVTGSGTAVALACSKEARVPQYGEWQVLTFTLGGTANEEFYYRTNAANTACPVGWQGQYMRGSVEISTNNSDAIAWLTLQLIAQDGTNPEEGRSFQSFDIAGTVQMWEARNRTGIIQIPYVRIPNDCLNLRWRVWIGIKGNAAIAPVIKIGRCEWRLTDNPFLRIGT